MRVQERVHNASAREGPQSECSAGVRIPSAVLGPQLECSSAGVHNQSDCSSAGSTIRVQECLHGLAMRSLKRKEREERNKKKKEGKEGTEGEGEGEGGPPSG